MDGDSGSSNGLNSGDPDTETGKLDYAVEISSGQERSGELRNFTTSQVLTRVELDLAYSVEKLLNLNVFMMRLATMENDLENIASENGKVGVELLENALHFDLMSGILDSEVSELYNLMTELEKDIVKAGEMITSYEHLGETFAVMKAKLHDSEESLKQSRDQVTEIRMQSTKFQQTLACLKGQEYQNGEEGPNFLESQLPNVNLKLDMQTAEQRMQLLRMLEKSMAREMDLEKKLTDSRKTEDELKQKQLTLKQESFFIEEEAIGLCLRKFEAENAAVVFMGVSRELLGRIQILQFNLNGSARRETELRTKLQKSAEQLEDKESDIPNVDGAGSPEANDLLISQVDGLKSSLKEVGGRLALANSKVFTLMEKMSELEKQLKESEFQLLNEKCSNEESSKMRDDLLSEVMDLKNTVVGLNEKLILAENRAEFSETKFKSLKESKAELHEKVDLLERKLEELTITFQHAVASAEASQEKQILWNATIVNMENLIENLKSKVLKSESRVDSTEDKCILLSEENERLNEELSFLRGSLHHAEETRIATAKDIRVRTKMITELVMQLATERERLHKQISSLAHENKTLVMKLQQKTKKPEETDLSYVNCESVVHSKGDVSEISTPTPQVDETSKTRTVGDPDSVDADNQSELETVRRMDASQLNFKHILAAMLIASISAAVYMFCPENLAS